MSAGEETVICVASDHGEVNCVASDHGEVNGVAETTDEVTNDAGMSGGWMGVGTADAADCDHAWEETCAAIGADCGSGAGVESDAGCVSGGERQQKRTLAGLTWQTRPYELSGEGQAKCTSIVTALPSINLPRRCRIASSASRSCSNSTKPYPLETPPGVGISHRTIGP